MGTWDGLNCLNGVVFGGTTCAFEGLNYNLLGDVLSWDVLVFVVGVVIGSIVAMSIVRRVIVMVRGV